MISRFKMNFELDKELNAEVLQEIDGTATSVANVYIPVLMPYIPKGEPKISPVITNGNSIFANSINRPALTGNIIHEKNYFTTEMNHEINVTDMNGTVDMSNKLLNDSIKKLAKLNKLKYELYVKKLQYRILPGTKVRVKIMNGKISHIAFNLTDQSNIDASLISGEGDEAGIVQG